MPQNKRTAWQTRAGVVASRAARNALSGWSRSGARGAFSRVDVSRSEDDVSNADQLKFTGPVF
jgi:hypothetical protein